MNQPPDLLTTAEAAEWLRVSPEALRVWRLDDRGPDYIKLGNRVYRYRPEDLQAWLDAAHITTSA